MNDKLKSLVMGEAARIDALRRQIEAPSVALGRLMPQNHALDAIQKLEMNIPRFDGVERMLESINAAAARDSEAIRLAVGPYDDMIKFHDQALRTSAAFEQMQDSLAIYVDRFQLPAPDKLTLSFSVDDSLRRIAEQFQQHDESLRRAVEAMRTPWLDMSNQRDSFHGIAALHGIGQAVESFGAFDGALSTILRTELGDWRDQISFPTTVFADIAARSAFYVERGFDARLTDFPVETFAEGIDHAQLRTDLPAPNPAYLRPDEAERDESEEDGFRRTESAYSQLLRLEHILRKFIDDRMSAQFGPNWAKTRTPNSTYPGWMEKKRIAEEAGGPVLPLIAYADFTEYVQIITRKDNWRVFKPTFRREEDVRESFQRLHPLRIATMHARLLTQDDELFLSVEVKRIFRAINGQNQ